ncbi:hypothetical protein [Thermoactinomyces daqus]|uniref:hypothetical protein n=1 Tax=Thermoactinomyces daqus TaxID=1329516 RepID=UPI00051A2527|nr:hypothetical protein [Thermoactinomyces daqus]
MNYAALRRYARESLRGTWGSAAGVTLLFLILVGPLSYIPFWGIFMSGTITIGYTLFILKRFAANTPNWAICFRNLKAAFI